MWVVVVLLFVSGLWDFWVCCGGFFVWLVGLFGFVGVCVCVSCLWLNPGSSCSGHAQLGLSVSNDGASEPLGLS